jgi:hypothetical protein
MLMPAPAPAPAMALTQAASLSPSPSPISETSAGDSSGLTPSAALLSDPCLFPSIPFPSSLTFYFILINFPSKQTNKQTNKQFHHRALVARVLLEKENRHLINWWLTFKALYGVLALICGNGFIVGINQIYDIGIDKFLPIPFFPFFFFVSVQIHSPNHLSIH